MVGEGSPSSENLYHMDLPDDLAWMMGDPSTKPGGHGLLTV
jgi:hypothetical protein